MTCGKTLTYHEKSEELKCMYCGNIELGLISCSQGHYICDGCHNRDAMRIIEDVVFMADSVNPFEIAERAISHSGLPMLGCQHAYIAGGALMAAIRNEGSQGVTKDDIREVFNRTEKQAHGGYCGLTGVCGIVPAIGACFAILTGSKCGKDKEQRMTMEAVTRVAKAIATLTGPSCCRAYVRTSLEEAVNYLKESIKINLPLSSGKGVCSDSLKHPHGCREMKCPYFKPPSNNNLPIS
jgi:hypothetical protein